MVLLKVNKIPKISFYNTILPLCLAINLKIKSDWKLLFNTKEVIEQ